MGDGSRTEYRTDFNRHRHRHTHRWWIDEYTAADRYHHRDDDVGKHIAANTDQPDLPNFAATHALPDGDFDLPDQHNTTDIDAYSIEHQPAADQYFPAAADGYTHTNNGL